MRSSLSNPASPSTLNFQRVTVSLILAERGGPDALGVASARRGRGDVGLPAAPRQQEHGRAMAEARRPQAPPSPPVAAQSGSRFPTQSPPRGPLVLAAAPAHPRRVCGRENPSANSRAPASGTPRESGPAGTPRGALPAQRRACDSGWPPCSVGPRAGARATPTEWARVPRTAQGAPGPLPSRSLGGRLGQPVDSRDAGDPRVARGSAGSCALAVPSTPCLVAEPNRDLVQHLGAPSPHPRERYGLPPSCSLHPTLRSPLEPLRPPVSVDLQGLSLESVGWGGISGTRH